MQNYHLVCLKMLANIFLTDQGKEFMQNTDACTQLTNFCTLSFTSINPKVIFTAAILLFNVYLCYRREKSLLADLS